MSAISIKSPNAKWILSSGCDKALAGIFDNAGHMLDPITLEALPLSEAHSRIAKMWQTAADCSYPADCR